MKIGTRSILYGAHAFYLHPWFVALAWWKLYGFPWDPRLWMAFFVHDLGYWGKPDMDGEEGERHPELGATIMGRLFDSTWPQSYGRWESFALYHSRYYAKGDNAPVSRLCYADKLALAITPWWLYLPMTWATGELREYMAQAQRWTHQEPVTIEEARAAVGQGARRWFWALQSYMRRWVEAHKDGRADAWTRERSSQVYIPEWGANVKLRALGAEEVEQVKAALERRRGN